MRVNEIRAIVQGARDVSLMNARRHVRMAQIFRERLDRVMAADELREAADSRRWVAYHTHYLQQLGWM